MGRSLIITIDGPAASGKSTVARALARRLNYTYIDSGAMYRAFGLAAAQKGISPEDEKGLEDFCQGLKLDFAYVDEQFRAFYQGEDITPEIRSEKAGELASRFSVSRIVRSCLTEAQRRMAEGGRVVVEGRDAGTVVFPEADAKFYLTAQAEARIQRRTQELKAGQSLAKTEGSSFMNITEKEVRQGLEMRDRRDASRARAPLAPAEDGVIIDSSQLCIDEVVEKMLKVVKDKEQLRHGA